jgi:predicted amino acid-binding ACT domain protein
MNSLSALNECNLWILDQCQTILCYIEEGNFDIKDIVQTIFESTTLLIHKLDISQRDKSKLLNKLERYSKFKQNQNMIKMLVSCFY